jgi:hypothetical protein
VLGHLNGLTVDGEWHCHLPHDHDGVRAHHRHPLVELCEWPAMDELRQVINDEEDSVGIEVSLSPQAPVYAGTTLTVILRRAGQTVGGKLRARLTWGPVLAGRGESGARPRISIAALDLACRYCPAAQHYLTRFAPLSPLTSTLMRSPTYSSGSPLWCVPIARREVRILPDPLPLPLWTYA